MAMVATIASESHQYLQDWFKKHYVTIGNKTSLILFATTQSLWVWSISLQGKFLP